ncbi:hypothetical protein EDD11_002786 [Mortierella claussenii]|nr:hypothetical protein EDD11_002786 [Mortierella claussenii]
MWLLLRRGRKTHVKGRGINSNKVPSGLKLGNIGNRNDISLSRSSSTASLWNPSTPPTITADDPMDDLINLSSFHHRAYVKSLLTPESDLRDAAGSMYGRSTVGSDKTAAFYGKRPAGARPRAFSAADESNEIYAGSTLSTTVSKASSSTADYTRYPTEYDFNVPKDSRKPPPLSPSAGFDKGRHFPFEQPTRQQSFDLSGGGIMSGGPGGVSARKSGVSTEKTTSFLSPPTRNMGPSRPPMSNRPSSSRSGPGAHKLTWNSATTSYTATSAAQPMTGAAPTPSAWEYVVYPRRLVWPSIVGTYLLIARLPLRILVAVLTTLVLCYDVLLSIGAAETVLAIPVSCLLGAMAYPGASQFDNTMNVARAMHTVNLFLIVVLLPAVVFITLLHQIRMVQKYNWCLRLLRTGNYSFVPGDYTQHLKHPVRFIGYTVGFGVVGLCFTIFLLFSLCTMVAMLLVAATFRSSLFRTLGSRALAAFGISCLLVFLLWLVQMLVIRYRFRMPGSRFFLAPQRSARASFHHWEFFWAFFNIVFGAFSFCKRIVLSVLSMGIYSTRIDLCIMGGRFRPWDGGYSAFVGLVLADHVLNHPIVLEFVQILRDLLLTRRHPHLAHYVLEARGRIQAGDAAEQVDDEAKAERDRRLMMILRPQQRAVGGGGGPTGLGLAPKPLNDIEEGEEARMDDLLMAASIGGVIAPGSAIKGGAAIPEVRRVHHYFRIDPRVDRHPSSQGLLSPTSLVSPTSSSPPPAYNNHHRASKIDTPLLMTTTTTTTTTTATGEPKARLQPEDPDSPVSPEQIRQKLSEAKLRSIRVRNRWFLYVTLVRNPSLCALRRTRVKDFLHPIGHGSEYSASHQEEMLTDIYWDRED